MVSARGLTIVELILVIAIIGILTSGTIAAINIPKQLQRARDSQRKTDIRTMQSAFELYRTDNQCYPGSSPCAALPACGNPLVVGASTYMQKIPCDPKGGDYTYDPSTPANGYTLKACLENDSDNDPNTQTVAAGVCPSSTKQYVAISP